MNKHEVIRIIVFVALLISVGLWPEQWFQPQEFSLASIMGVAIFIVWFAKEDFRDS